MVMSHTRMCPITVAQEVSPSFPAATMTTGKSTGGISGSSRSDTGYIRVDWWDDTTDIYGTGISNERLLWSKDAGGGGTKILKVYSCDAAGEPSGTMTRLSCNNNLLTELDLTGLSGLTNLVCDDNSLTSLDLSKTPALDYLSCTDNALTSLDASNMTALTSLGCDNNALTSLNVTGSTALAVLSCSNNSLTSLDVSNLTNLTAFYCNNNSLTSLRAVGVPGSAVYGNSGSYSSPYYDGVMIANNLLDSSALGQVYTDLADNTLSGGYALLFVGGNPGAATDDPIIATSKNWVVLGT